MIINYLTFKNWFFLVHSNVFHYIILILYLLIICNKYLKRRYIIIIFTQSCYKQTLPSYNIRSNLLNCCKFNKNFFYCIQIFKFVSICVTIIQSIAKVINFILFLFNRFVLIKKRVVDFIPSRTMCAYVILPIYNILILIN